MKVLVTAASRHGATAEIASAIASRLSERGHQVVLVPPEQVETVDTDAAVIGSAVYTGHWLDPARRLVEGQAERLRERPVWLFSSGPVGDPSRPLVKKMDVDPVEVPRLLELAGGRAHRRFAGKLDPMKLSRPQRLALRAVRGLAGDFRDWNAITGWADAIASALDHPAGEEQRGRPVA